MRHTSNNELTKDDIQVFLSGTTTVFANSVISSLSNLKRYKDAFDSEVGRLFLQDIKTLMEANFNKVISNTATDIEKAEISACKKIMGMWAERYSKYSVAVGTVKNGRKKH